MPYSIISISIQTVDHFILSILNSISCYYFIFMNS